MTLVFVHLPRTGGTSIGQYLLACGVPVRNIIHNAAKGTCSLDCCWFPGKQAPLPSDAFFFGFVRNPWSWYVSRYFYFRRQKLPERGVSKQCELGVRTSPNLSFRDHLLTHIEHEWFWMTHRYQHLFCDDEGKLLLSLIGRTESINKGLNVLFAMHDLKPKMSYTTWDQTKANWKKRNTSVHDHYSSYYDDELMRLVADKDRLLISTYGYVFERKD